MAGERKPQIGDHVVIHAWYCDMDGKEGDIIGISSQGSMPYMVRLSNYREWPFDEHELELRSIEMERYEHE